MTNWLAALLLSLLLYSDCTISAVFEFEFYGKAQISETETSIDGSPFKWISRTYTTPDITVSNTEQDNNCFEIESYNLGFDSSFIPVVSKISYLVAPRNPWDNVGWQKVFAIELFESSDCSIDETNTGDVPVIIQFVHPATNGLEDNQKSIVTFDLSDILTSFRRPWEKAPGGIVNVRKKVDLRRPQGSFKFLSISNFSERWEERLKNPAVFVFKNPEGVQAAAPQEYSLMNLNTPFGQDE